MNRSKRFTWAASQFQSADQNQTEEPVCPRLARRSINLSTPNNKNESIANPSPLSSSLTSSKQIASNIQTRIHNLSTNDTPNKSTSERTSPKRKLGALDGFNPQVETKIEYFERLARELGNAKRMKNSSEKVTAYQEQSQENLVHIQMLENELESVRKETATLCEEKRKSEEAYQMLEQRWNSERNQLILLETQITDLEGTVSRQRSEVEALQLTKLQKDEHIKSLEMNFESEKEQWKTEQAKLVGSLDNLRQMNHSKVAFEQEVRKEIARLEQSEQDHQKKITELAKLLEEELNEGEEFQNQVQKELNYLKTKLEEQYQEKHILLQQIEEKNQQRERLEEEIGVLREKMEAQTKAIEKLQQELETEKSSVASLQEELLNERLRTQQLENNIQESNVKRQQLLGDMESLKIEMKEQLLKGQESLESQQANQQEELRLLRFQLELERDQHALIQKQLKEELEYTDETIEFREQIENAFENQFEELQRKVTRIRQLEETINLQNRQLEDLNVELSVYKKEIDRYRQSHLDLQVQLAKMNTLMLEKEIELEQLSQQSMIEAELNRALTKLNKGILSAHPMKTVTELKSLFQSQENKEDLDKEVLYWKDLATKKDVDISDLYRRINEKDCQIDLLQRMLQRRKEKSELHVQQIVKFYEAQLATITSEMPNKPSFQPFQFDTNETSFIEFTTHEQENPTPMVPPSPIASTPRTEETRSIAPTTPLTTSVLNDGKAVSSVKKRVSIASPSTTPTAQLRKGTSKSISKSGGKKLSLPVSIKLNSPATPSKASNAPTYSSSTTTPSSILKSRERSSSLSSSKSLSLPKTIVGPTDGIDLTPTPKKSRRPDIRSVFRQLSANKL